MTCLVPIEQDRKCLEQIMVERKSMEVQLRAVQSQLEDQLCYERDTNQQSLEKKNMQLNKTKLLSTSLDKRCKVLYCCYDLQLYR